MAFTSANAVQNAVLSAESRNRSPVKMLRKMQDQLMEAVLNPETEPREKAQCACAWDKLEGRLAVLQGKPANTSQSIKSEPVPRARKSDSGPLEPIPEEKQEQ